jgi:hypothetical protein
MAVKPEVEGTGQARVVAAGKRSAPALWDVTEPRALASSAVWTVLVVSECTGHL